MGLGKQLIYIFFHPGLVFISACYVLATGEEETTAWVIAAMVLAGLSMLVLARWRWAAHRLMQAQSGFAVFVVATGRLLEQFVVSAITGLVFLSFAWGCLIVAMYQESSSLVWLLFIVFFVLSRINDFRRYFVGSKAFINQPNDAETIYAVRVTPAQAPALWEKLDEAAQLLQCPLPDHVLIGWSTVDSFFEQRARFYLPDHNEMLTGRMLYLPFWLFLVLSPERFKASLVDELGCMKLDHEVRKKGGDFGWVQFQAEFMQTVLDMALGVQDGADGRGVFADPAMMCLGHLSPFLQAFRSRVELEQERCALQVLGREKVLSARQWHLILRPVAVEWINDFFRWRVARDRHPVAVLQEKLDRAIVARAVADFGETFARLPPETKKRLLRLGFDVGRGRAVLNGRRLLKLSFSRIQGMCMSRSACCLLKKYFSQMVCRASLGKSVLILMVIGYFARKSISRLKRRRCCLIILMRTRQEVS